MTSFQVDFALLGPALSCSLGRSISSHIVQPDMVSLLFVGNLKCLDTFNPEKIGLA